MRRAGKNIFKKTCETKRLRIYLQPNGCSFDLLEPGRPIRNHLEIINMKEIDKWLEQLRKIWENRFNQLDKLLAKLKNRKK